MKRSAATLFCALTVILSLSCNPWQAATRLAGNREPRVSFHDRTEEVVSHAARLIENNQFEGAALNQRWYGLKYFGKHLELILGADKIIFFGGLERDVRTHLASRYASLDPVEENQDSGDVRLFTGKRPGARYDFVVIGQNGREVALKTIIRLLYLAVFTDDKTRAKFAPTVDSEKRSIQVFMSSVTPRQEYIAFFKKHGLDSPDAVMIGFSGDIRSLLNEEGISDPESHTDESLKVNWYPDASGKKVLLVSIDKNRIFASRSGDLIEAIFAISDAVPPSITFLGSAGAIDAPDRVGQLVTPMIVMDSSSDPASRQKGVLVHLIRNKAAAEGAVKTANVTVESVVVETTQWARNMKSRRIDTVDQELFHIVNAINSSAHAAKVDLFAGHVVTDNVSWNAQETDLTLEHAEEVISSTADIRRQFFSKVLRKLGILKNEKSGLPNRSQTERTRALSSPAR
jgi:hypothetical protein